ncbi:MAG: nucleoside hydrolase [Dehalococcoidia bacterium]|jgi:inosine-uridine nucleoside N-ribohydrolase|nr:nucleoside hydrolase [Dehalococcoidia bacterium]
MSADNTPKTTKVLFDTDIGSDIDDAVALAYLLAQPRCQLLGITTVSGQPVERAKLASAICRTAGREITIVPGTEERLDGPTRQPNVPQVSVLPIWPHETAFSEQGAVDFMAETVRANPNEVVLLAVGPMTNVARLFTAHPDVPGLLKSLHLMSGRFTDSQVEAPSAEWNVHCDPAAAAVVYSPEVHSVVTRHTSIGLDVTHQVVMNSEEVERHFQHPLLSPVLEMSRVWFDEREQLRFHDPLAAVTLFDESICGFEQGTARIRRAEGRDDGAIDWSPDANGPHRAAMTVDAARFFDSYFGVFA